MIETTIRNYLASVLGDIPVVFEVPEDPEEQFVKIERTAGSLENHIYHSVFAVQSYAPTLYASALLNETVRDAMLDAVVLDDIASVKLNAEYNYTDPSTKQARYQSVYDIVHY